MRFSPVLIVACAALLADSSAASPLFVRQDDNATASEGVVDPHSAPPFPAGFTQGPIANGGVGWAEAFEKAKALVNQMTLSEMVNVTTGQDGPCVGNSGSVPRLGLQSICAQDGPAGPRPVDLVSSFPAGVTVAATWDEDLIYARALAIGEEFKGKGVQTALGPVTGGPIGRSPLGGRGWEGHAPDAFLNGVASRLSVRGIQDAGVVAIAKHWLGYEQDSWRRLNQPLNVDGNLTALYQQIDSQIDDKTIHELYTWGFAEAIRAGAGGVMSAYNSFNGTHAGSNHKLLNVLLKEELNFQGHVMSDWGGTWDTTEDINAGMDQTQPGFGYAGQFGSYFGDELINATNAGDVPQSRVADAAIRILTPYFWLGQDVKHTTPNFDYNTLGDVGPFGTNEHVNVQADHWKIILQIGQESATLLKNTDSNSTLGLPIPSSVDRIGIFGSSAGPPDAGLTGCGPFLNCFDNPADESLPPSPKVPSPVLNGTAYGGGGSGSVYAPYVTSPLEAITARFARTAVTVDSALDGTPGAYIDRVAANSDVALVFVSAFQTEGWDREDLKLHNNEDELILRVAEQNANTVVVIHSGQTVDMEAWIEHENVTAVVFAYYPGQETGPAITSVLWGDVSPSGKLPFTVGKSIDDYPGGAESVIKDDVFEPTAYFEEGVFIDYKWFDAKNITPRFPFGFGLTYSSFVFSAATVESTPAADAGFVMLTNEAFDGEGSLYDQLLTLGVTVQNTGEVEAAEVAQVYMSWPSSVTDQPIRNLRGFAKAKLAPGASETLSFAVRQRDLAVWDVERQTYTVPAGEYTFAVGRDSRDLPVSVTYTV